MAVKDLVIGTPAKALKPDDWTYLQSLLVSQSRALMRKADLADRRQFGAKMPMSSDEQAAANVGALIAINARRALVPTFTEYQGIYCAHWGFEVQWKSVCRIPSTGGKQV